MELYTYKCIPLLFRLTMDDEFLSDTAVAYESVLNKAARDGWQFVRIDTINADSTEENFHNGNITNADKLCTKVFIFKKLNSSGYKQSAAKNYEFINEKSICPSCHNEVSESDLFCENCAYKLK